MKTCTTCKVEKPLTAFSKDKSFEDELRCQCRDCSNADQRRRRIWDNLTNPGKIEKRRIVEENVRLGRKVCPQCHRTRPLTKFYKDTSQCGDCKSAGRDQDDPRRIDRRQKAQASKERSSLGLMHCSRCDEIKPLALFSRGTTKSGTQLWCKACISERSRQRWELMNPGSAERRKTAKKAMLFGLQLCIKCDEVKSRTRFRKDTHRKNRRSSTCKDCRRISDRKQRLKYPGKYRIQKNQWRKDHLVEHCAGVARRYAIKIRAIPGGMAHYDTRIDALYLEAADLKRLGFGTFHVDHIIPLNPRPDTGEPSGLHVLANLRVITAEMNMRKGNRPIE